MVTLTVRGALHRAEEQLKAAGVLPAAFEARRLLSGIVPDSALLTAPEKELSADQIGLFDQRLGRRLNGEPLQYILGAWEFYSLPFFVGSGVLIPRPDTELLVDLALDFLKRRPHSNVADLCTGSGCVAVAVAKNASNARVTAFEISDEAIAYFNKNRELNNADVALVQCDILNYNSSEKFDLILSNPPYIPSGDLASLDREVGFEPRLALDGGEDGLRFYRAIAEIWNKCLNPGGALMVEIGIGEADSVSEIFLAAGLENITVHKDINGIDRVVSCEKTNK